MNKEIKKCQLILSKLDITFKIDDILSPSRLPKHVVIRSYISVILRQQKYTLAQIGEILGGRTHATIINLLKYNKKRQARDTNYTLISKTLKINENNKQINTKILFHKKQIEILKKLIK